METCARGFSFIPETKMEVLDLQYIENEELERTWRTTLRQRHKQREQKVWDEFIKEQDVVHKFCKEDPYQFLEQLPEEYVNEMIEVESRKLKAKEIEYKADEQTEPDDSSAAEEVQQVVTFVDEEVVDEEETYFQIFESEKDNDASGPEDEVLNESMGTPCTVRENSLSPVSPGTLPPEKSPEHVANLTENSIHCTKVKELRTKINEEICAILSWLENQAIDQAQESEDIVRRSRRSTEFCTRFTRVHMYQLQRQLNDIKRNNAKALPYAKHTHFQSQMLRILSLHQHVLHSYQVFRKSLPQTNCMGVAADTLAALLRATRDVSAHCGATHTASGFAPVLHLYEDGLVTNCDRMEQAVNDYSKKMETAFKSTENNRLMSPRKKCNERNRYSKNGGRSARGADMRLSMYSLDTLRVNTNTKSTSSKDNHSRSHCKKIWYNSITLSKYHYNGSSKMRGVSSSTGRPAGNTDAQPKTPKKTPRNRRPLMRDPQIGRTRPLRASRDTDIRTMVEAVETCASSHISREGSTSASPREQTRAPRHHTRTPSAHMQRKSQNATPRSKLRAQSPKAKNRRVSPKANRGIKFALNSITSELQDTTGDSHVQMMPTSKIQPVKKGSNTAKNDAVSSYDSVKYTENGNDNSLKVMGNVKFSESAKVTGNVKVDKSVDQESVKVFNCGKDDDVDVLVESANVIGNGESSNRQSSRMQNDEGGDINNDKGRKGSRTGSTGCEVTELVKQLCSGDDTEVKNARVTGTKNVQLLCINSGSPRRSTTPHLLKILEETIQKKTMKPLYQKQTMMKDAEKHRLTFNIKEKTTENLFSYRTKFVQHMLASPMYANSAVGKPWEVIGSISEKIIDELVLAVAKDMEIQEVVQELYNCETS